MIYTQKAEQALKLAKRASARLKHPYIGTEHILIGLLEEETGAAGQVLAGAGVTVEALTDMISQLIAPESGSLMEPGRDYTPRARKILEDAAVEAKRFHEQMVGTEHILISILKDGECVGSRLLNTMSVRLRELYTELVTSMGEKANEYREDGRVRGTQTLEQYSRDLTELAEEGFFRCSADGRRTIPASSESRGWGRQLLWKDWRRGSPPARCRTVSLANGCAFWI